MIIGYKFVRCFKHIPLPTYCQSDTPAKGGGLVDVSASKASALIKLLFDSRRACCRA